MQKYYKSKYLTHDIGTYEIKYLNITSRRGGTMLICLQRNKTGSTQTQTLLNEALRTDLILTGL